MPQVSASLDTFVINAVSELAAENKPIRVSFSTMIKALLSTHPQVLAKVKEINNRKQKPKSKK